jgi:glutamine amidotransferase
LAGRIAIINTHAANLHSVSKALEKVGANAAITSDAAEIAAADGAVLPGVGASDAVMGALNNQRLTEPVKAYIASGRPLLCVCLGMQVLFDRSDEGELPGLGVVRGRVKRFPADLNENGQLLKVPHMGWNSVRFSETAQRNPVFAGIPQDSYFYFVHSYRCQPDDPATVAGTARYGEDVCAAVISGEIVGTQFHPEKSGDVGLQIYENFVKRVG